MKPRMQLHIQTAWIGIFFKYEIIVRTRAWSFVSQIPIQAVCIGNHNFFTKTCQRQTYQYINAIYVCTGFTEVLDNFGRSDDDMF